MNTVDERLSTLFGDPAFLEANADRGTISDIFEAVNAQMSDITIDELEDYLTRVSKMMDETDLSEDDLSNVSGGIGFLGACAAIAGVGAAISVFYKGGKAIGEAVYYLTH